MLENSKTNQKKIAKKSLKSDESPMVSTLNLVPS